MRFTPAPVVVLLLFVNLGAHEPSQSEPPDVRVQDLATTTESLLVGLSVVSDRVVWVSGTNGTFGRTVDGGGRWTFGVVPEADSLQFRDVHGISATSAYLLSIGPGDQSRIYKTVDAGISWTHQWTNPEPDGFFDCFDFWSDNSGIAMGDAVRGRIMMVRTENGSDWPLIPESRIPEGVDGEGGFAASGTCLITKGDSTAFIATGSSGGAKVYRTHDRGQTWTVVMTPVIAGVEASGIMTLAFRTPDVGFAAGGALSQPDDPKDQFAVTVDGGESWNLAGTPQLPNIYGIAASPDLESSVILAVGPKGMDVSYDDGVSWSSVDKRNYWSVAFVNGNVALAVGPRGRIARVTIL